MSIALLVPTRGRPGAAAALADTFRATTHRTTTELLFLVDDDDPELGTYCGSDLPISTGPRLAKGMGAALNRAAVAQATDCDVVGFLGDDHRLRTVNWDVRVEQTLHENPGVAYGNDLIHGPNLPTAAFVSSDLIRTLGYMSPPGLMHLYIDNFWLELGRATSLHYLPDVTIEHLHPIAQKAEWDEGYREVNSGEMQAHDHAEFQRYMAQDWPAAKEKVLARSAAV